MSLRTTSGVIAVDKESGKVIWHAGPEVVAQQHTPVEMENGSILVFDNGNLRPGVTSPHSTVLEFDPQIKAITAVSRYLPAGVFLAVYGKRAALANGNTFICESAFGRLFEVTPEGETVWEYIIPFFNEYPEHLSKGIILENRTAPSVRIAMPLMPLVG